MDDVVVVVVVVAAAAAAAADRVEERTSRKDDWEGEVELSSVLPGLARNIEMTESRMSAAYHTQQRVDDTKAFALVEIE